MPVKKLKLDGFFEKERRNPLIAAFVIVLAAGAVYFFISQIVVTLVITIDSALNPDRFADSGGILERIGAFYAHYRYFILGMTSLMQFGIIFGLTIVFVRKWHTKNWIEYFRYRSYSPLALPLTMVATIAVIPLVLKFAEIYYHLFPVLKKLQGMTSPLFSAQTWTDAFLLFFVICITPAVCEEALFRGYFQRTLARKWRALVFIPVTAVLFALFHQSPLGLPPLILVGAFLGVLYYAFDSLWVPMFAHMLYNALIVTLHNIPPAELPWLYSAEGYLKWSVFTSAFVVFFGSCWLILYLFKIRSEK